MGSGTYERRIPSVEYDTLKANQRRKKREGREKLVILLLITFASYILWKLITNG